jgi:Uma2 family endonuclease
MSVATHLITADELDQFPNDGKRREVIGGELHVSPAPLISHQDLVKWILAYLLQVIEEPGHGKVIQSPVDVRFSEYDQVQPDIVGIKADRLDTCRGNTVYGAPDIVIEVLSPSTERYDRIEKKRLYEGHAVPEYWIFDPKLQTLMLLRLEDRNYAESEAEHGVFRSTAIIDFTIDPAALFVKVTPE